MRRSIVALRAAPPPVQIVVGVGALLAVWAVANWAYQAIRKPTELFFPVSGVLAKSPAETWRSYGPLFNKHSTPVITPALLAALAQVEGSGNPVARTYWRWRPARNPFKVYQPASSAVGMYQITDGTFSEARRYCIHDHVVAEDGAWLDPSSCWFNFLYSRVVPSHAIEMTSALLDRRVASAIARHRVADVTPERQQDLAAVIHLCGPRTGDAFAARGFRPAAGQRCGDHDLGAYLAKVNAMKRRFARMATAGQGVAGGGGLRPWIAIMPSPGTPATDRAYHAACFTRAPCGRLATGARNTHEVRARRAGCVHHRRRRLPAG